MSINRRRWTNKLAESMREFQRGENNSFEMEDCASSNLVDTGEFLKNKNLDDPKNVAEELDATLLLDDSDSLKEADTLGQQIDCIDLNSVVETMTTCSENSANQFIQSSSDNAQVFYSCDSFESNEGLVTSILNNKPDKISNCNPQDLQIKNQNNLDVKKYSKDFLSQRFFSSPVDLHNSGDIINKIEQPDVWDALIALEQALSPFDENEKNEQKDLQNQAYLLNRLSQKFRETPTKFTEKLVSIIEDTHLSSESPAKKSENDTSGISLHRMTGEFRKLCKFIEDESMPEWAPSLMNGTSYFDKTETPIDKNINQNVNSKSLKNVKNYVNTPAQKLIQKTINSFVTPKNKTESKPNTPITKFTPSNDHSFEYWEKFCNILCNTQSSGKKKLRRSISVTESTKRSLNEMLKICDRQMASLDDSVCEIRNSEPCKKTDDLKVINTPRSKSESKIFIDTSKIHKSLNIVQEKSLVPQTKDNEELDKANNSINEYSPCLDKNGQFNVKTLSRSSNDSEVFLSIENSADNDDQDCSLLIELAKRRQRCLDTAKLMMEIESEDPITSGDNKCLETLYKLGVQDKTFIDNEEDAKFLNTLSHCFEYNDYFSNKSKPLFNMLQSPNSTNELKSKAKSIIKSSKKSLNQSKSVINLNSTKKIQKPLPLESKTGLKTPYNNKKLQTPRSAIKSKLPERQDNRYLQVPNLQVKVTPRVENKSTHLHNSQARSSYKMTPKITPRENSQIDKKNAQHNSYQKKISSISTPKPQLKTPQPQSKLSASQLTKSTSKLTPEISKKLKQSNEKKAVLQVTKQNLTVKKVSVSPKNPCSTVSSPDSLCPNVLNPKSPCTNVSSTKNPCLAVLNKKSPCPKVSSKNCSSSSSKSPINDENCSDNIKTNIFDVVTSPIESPDQYSNNKTPETMKKPRLFLTPGKSPCGFMPIRKKPTSYFSDLVPKKSTPIKSDYDGVKSPLNLYIHGTDADLIQNVKGRVEDFLLTPVRDEESKSSKLKLKLSSNNNKIPYSDCDENAISTVRYQSADKVCLIDDKASFSPRAITPNSRTRKLLGPIENTIVIRHEGRVIEYNPDSSHLNAETSIRVQKMAQKTTTIDKWPQKNY